jgi:predicted  nucleic acid-binding Zn-ribbon protein
MSTQSDFDSASKSPASNEVEEAGQNILQSLHKAADEAAADREAAQRLSQQLRKAENRIAELEAEVQLYKAKMDRAKQWLHQVFSQIEERLLG